MTTSFKKTLLFSLSILLATIAFSHQKAFSTQESEQSSAGDQIKVGEDPDDASVGGIRGLRNAINFKGDDYKYGNYPNTTYLYWSFGLPDISNDSHVDYFLQVNECELFKKYYGNEFEWGPLRETTREFLSNKRDKFSRKLYFDLPIKVGQYNIENGHFGVISTNFNSGQRDFFPYLDTRQAVNCGIGRGVKQEDKFFYVYPLEPVFRFIRPLMVPHIKVDEETAKELVQGWKDVYTNLDQNRFLAIRLFITVTKYSGFQDFQKEDNVPVFLSYINGYQIYKTMNMQELLYTKSYKTRRKDKTSNNSAVEDDEYE